MGIIGARHDREGSIVGVTDTNRENLFSYGVFGGQEILNKIPK